MAQNPANEEEQHNRNITYLIEEYGNRLGQSTIAQIYQEMCFRYKDARIRIYVPLFIMRDTKDSLSRLPMDVHLENVHETLQMK